MSGAWAIGEIPTGARLAGRYTIQKKLGDGSVASVYLAEDELGTAVALKVLDPLRGADPVGRMRFVREFEVLCSIAHPGVARPIRLDQEGDLEMLVLEHLPGDTLRERLDRGRLSIDEALAIATGCAEALAACHRAGVLHRDLKPENVVLHPERGPVILDFGSAWFSSAANLTRTGAMLGSPQYVAPEVFTSSLADARSDVYSLGVILFEMLTGHPVHLASGADALALAHAHARYAIEPPAPSRSRPEVPPDLDALVLRAIAPRAEERFATVAELLSALRDPSSVNRSAALADPRLPCPGCATPLLVRLPFCPGCGREVDWELSPGPYAVQITAVRDPSRAVEWLIQRHGPSLAASPEALERRLLHAPCPLLVGASSTTAEQLAADARAAGLEVEIVRARRLIGARLLPSVATRGEALGAGAVHVAAVVGLGVAMLGAGAAELSLFVTPVLVALVGLAAARSYLRRPLLEIDRARAPERRAHPSAAAVRARLARLRTERARRLAAGAIARAAPLLIDSAEPQGPLALLERALEAAEQVDVHTQALAARSRSRLAVELEAARARIDRGDTRAIDRLAELEAEKTELTEISVAHDLAARRALEACQAISASVAG